MALLFKLISLPFFPVGAAFTLLAASLVLFFRLKKTDLAYYLCAAGALIPVFFGLSPVANIMMSILENRYPPLKDHETASAIVVLGGGGVPASPPRIEPEINSAGDRILHGARLFHRGCAPFIVTCGRYVTLLDKDAKTEARLNADLLTESFGIDASHILVEEEAGNTRQHPGHIEKLLKSRGLSKDIILVTSACHMPRSAGVFRKAGFELQLSPTDFHSSKKFMSRLTGLFPNGSALLTSTNAIHEFYGLFAYKIFGWI